VNEKDLKFIDWSKFKNVKVLDKGVCGGKVCCIEVMLDYRGKKYILKEMRKSFNLGRDYIMMDDLKEKFGVRKIGMKRIRSNKYLDMVDKDKKSLVGNWKFVEGNCVYCMMEYFENVGDLGKNKEFLKKKSVVEECVRIRLFDGLFCSSDNIFRNILVNKDGDLLSIDENNIFGNRKRILNERDWFKKNKVDMKVLEKILEEFDLKKNVKLVERKMKKYGFEDKVEEMKERFENYEKIVKSEFE
jgi:hypothetical protein